LFCSRPALLKTSFAHDLLGSRLDLLNAWDLLKSIAYPKS
jgi:hypothetical protein